MASRAIPEHETQPFAAVIARRVAPWQSSALFQLCGLEQPALDRHALRARDDALLVATASADQVG
ncbi:hypothetical protein CCR84_04630 [Rhodocyclus purpureus]|nr:hypothetical protein [Rhodocyclus purpureus]